ncbi:DUF1329 domain-containing protein [Paraburkholderia silviterrae]|uniref:DUF1329 domain-containing protein n=1 Tax=Paraburkholderia silviterrae TaxID=2528715 RepID=A0A4R5M6S8_9BURK|nr:DUF1329 domain-containing protein [Paraburkholderia silviterrae]TDG21755.1 DUF1329 domain-containing protein [Paraburkholderia silviterrae]
MKRILPTALRASALVFGAAVAVAASAMMTPAEVKQLDGPLTPVGAERAGNADGTIPAWTGKWFGVPSGVSYTPGERYPDPYASEKPLVVITAQNMQQYESKLTEGEKALFKKYPGTFKMLVYPSHRDFRISEGKYKAIREWAARTTMTSDYNGLHNFPPLAPFPIPKTGLELMWNLRFASDIEAEDATYDQAVVYPNGNISWGKSAYVIYAPVGADVFDPKNPLNAKSFYRQTTLLPLSDRGTIITGYEMWDQEGTDTRRTWVYNPGTRRVRQAPEFGFDQPDGAGGFRTVDDDRLFNGSGQRYDWKIVGKREVYIPYDNYKLMDPKVKYSSILTPGHENMDYMRFELHRVWVLEATLKTGFRHQYAKRVLYLDEDTWNAVAADNYDARGTLWRTNFAPTLYAYDAKDFYPPSCFYHDLISGAYLADRLSNEESMPSLVANDKSTESYYSPDAIRGAGK